MKKIIIFVIILVMPLKLNAVESYVVMDSNSGRVLGSKNMNEEMLIASTTKIMTAIIAIENASLTDVYCANSETNSVYGSMIYIENNECMLLYDLLVGLMLRSGNDAAMIVATNVMGYESFIKAMNEKAKSLGMNSTHFENPHGLDDESQNTSTAYDLAILMMYAMKNKIFEEITSLKKFAASSSSKTYLWYNKNKLLETYKFSTGGKIGYTTKSGHIFVSSATKANEKLIIVTMKDDDQFVTHKKLYEEYFKKYDNYKILVNYSFSLKDNYYKDYHLYIKEDVDAMLNKDELKYVDVKIDLIKKKRIKDNNIVGEAKIYIKDKYLTKVNIYALENVSKKKSFFNYIKDHL